MKRILLAGLLGGLAVFLWEGLAHMVLPLGQAGFRSLPDEPGLSRILKQQVQDAGLYIFPAPEFRPGMSAIDRQKSIDAAMERSKAGPTGLLLVHPDGRPELTSAQLGTQVAADILGMLVAAWLLWMASLRAYASRVLFVTAMSLFPILQAYIPYWNWYGFPASFTAAAAITNLVGCLVGGLVVARFVRPPAKA